MNFRHFSPKIRYTLLDAMKLVDFLCLDWFYV